MTLYQSLFRVLMAATGLVVLVGCAHVLPPSDQVYDAALVSTDRGMLYATSQRVRAQLEPGESAFWLLDRADFSFEARLALVDRAISSLDMQYFIWEADATSRLLARRVISAADRGVRIRLLLDDLTLKGQDDELYALSSHPNIEVRTFNPWRSRSKLGRVTEFLRRSRTLNHRMHNKIITADGQFAVVGGRNIGDRYFGTWDAFVQNDLDVLAAGPIVRDVSASFDLYWNSDEAYPLASMLDARAAAIGDTGARLGLAEFTKLIEGVYLEAGASLSVYPVEAIGWDAFFESIIETFVPGIGRLEQDLPDIRVARPVQLAAPLYEFLAQARERVLLIAPYLIPDEEFIAMVADLEARGVEVVILTNSLASNNHIIAHSGYKDARRVLLEIGVDLFESRADSSAIEHYTVPPAEPAFLGLHSKAAVVDGRWSFIGSPNIDPRSLVLNTELGFFIDSPELARQVTALIERDLEPDTAWRVSLNDRNQLRWTSSRGTVTRQPARNFAQRVIQFFINFFPLDEQA